MRRRSSLFLLCCLGGLAAASDSAFATPVYLDKSEAVAPARLDPGTGLCGSVTKFVNQSSPLVTIDQAISLLDRPAGDPNIANRAARLFQAMNFSVGPGSEADFTGMMFPDDYFPYCQDPMANPPGPDDNNIAMRIRGYLNVTDTHGGQPVTFAVKCDDGCSLAIGRSQQQVTQANDDSPQLTGRRARWVTFLDPGLYPIELVYFQNSTTGYLEWSRAAMSVFASDDLAVDNPSWEAQAMNFAPLSGADLYSGVIGSNPTCQECGAPGMDCSTGNYCGDGLCQPCNVADHCGATCMKCPDGRPICDAGKCVECTSDAMCPSGSKCDTTTGTCEGPMPCTTNAQCKPPEICRPEGVCGDPPPCTTDVDCSGGIGCACTDGTSTCKQKVCIVPPDTCADDSQCPSDQFCDRVAGLCSSANHILYEGGLVGCSIGRGASRSSGAGGASLFFGLFALSLLALRSGNRRRSFSL